MWGLLVVVGNLGVSYLLVFPLAYYVPSVLINGFEGQSIVRILKLSATLTNHQLFREACWV